MKRKILVSIFLLLILCGCTPKVNINLKKGEGKLYKQISLKDQNVNTDVFTGLIPSDWKTYIESKWDVVSSTCPGREEVTISSPNSLARIKIVSQQAFVENNKYNEGENKDYYTTYLHYMNASEYIDYYLNNNYGNVQKVKDVKEENEDDIIKQLDEYNNITIDEYKKSLETINISAYGMSANAESLGSSVSTKQYTLGDNYLEGSAVVTGATYTLNSRFLTQVDKAWRIPYVIVYSADNKEEFDKYYDDYKFIIANSNFTTNYYALVEYVSSAIVNAYSSYYAAKSKAGLDAMNNYIDSNYSSTTSESTNDKVMKMWDDVIKEVDEYETLDGNKVRTSIHNDVVAQNGNEFYVGTKSGIPYGFTELEKKY